MLVSQIESPKELKGFLLTLFGYQNVLSKKPFLGTLESSDCSWIFSAPEIKRRINYFLNEEVLLNIMGM